MNGQSLLETAFDIWTADLLHSFLTAQVPENDRIEYKEQFSDSLQDTLVSFSNGDGGFIFVGVKEASGKKIPAKWWLLDSAKDNAGTVYNKAGSETTPPVRPLVRAFDDPKGTGQIVVIKVELGDNPPYFAKQRGVRVRVGDTDIPADPRVLETLFARRTSLSELGLRHHRVLADTLAAPGIPSGPAVLRFCIYLAPFYSTGSFRFTEWATEIVENEVNTQLSKTIQFPFVERRRSDGIDFGKPGDEVLSLRRDGQLMYTAWYTDPTPPVPTRHVIPIIDLAHRTLALLYFVERVYPQVVGYDGPMYFGVGLTGINDRVLGFPNMNVDPPDHIAPSEPFDIWIADETPYRIGDDPIVVTREPFKQLCWRLGYRGYERLFDGWGSAVERKPKRTI